MSPDLKRTKNSWRAMHGRCNNSKNASYSLYGAKGITIASRWNSFDNFLADMGLRPEGKTLDRWPNGAGNYEPGNCRWATPTEQIQNSTRCYELIEFRGRAQSVNAWTKELGLAVNTLHRRLRKGWSIEKALTTPSGGERDLIEFQGRRLTARAWSRELGLGKNTVRDRLNAGLPVEHVLSQVGRAQ